MGVYGVYAVGVVVALAAAVVVIALANRGSEERTEWRSFLADFKAGWRDRRNLTTDPEPVDVPFDELFAAESAPGDDYLHLDEFGDMIDRTGDRAGQLWHRDGTGHPSAQGRGPWTVRPRGHRPGPHRTGEAPETAAPRTPRRTSISSQH